MIMVIILIIIINLINALIIASCLSCQMIKNLQMSRKYIYKSDILGISWILGASFIHRSLFMMQDDKIIDLLYEVVSVKIRDSK